MADDDRVTIKTARAQLADIGYSLRHMDGEFRVAPKGGSEEHREVRAYYTTDLADAVGTAKAERSRAVLLEGALTATLDRMLDGGGVEAQAQGRCPGTASQYPGERLLDRFAGIARHSDDDHER